MAANDLKISSTSEDRSFKKSSSAYYGLSKMKTSGWRREPAMQREKGREHVHDKEFNISRKLFGPFHTPNVGEFQRGSRCSVNCSLSALRLRIQETTVSRVTPFLIGIMGSRTFCLGPLFFGLRAQFLPFLQIALVNLGSAYCRDQKPARVQPPPMSNSSQSSAVQIFFTNNAQTKQASYQLRVEVQIPCFPSSELNFTKIQ